VSTKIVPYTKNRELIYDLLTRAKRFHSSVSVSCEFDVEDLLKARKGHQVNGRPVGMTACVIKATGLVLAKYPRFNHHLFHGLFRKYEVAFDTINCTLIVMRRDPSGERLLFPVIIERADELSVEEIQAIIDQHKFGKLEDLPQVAALQRLKRLPRVALSYMSYKVRSDYRFYQRYFGTYGVSPMPSKRLKATGGHTYSNTCSSFLIGPVRDKPVVVRGEIVVQKQLGVILVADHFLVDGMDILEALRYLDKVLGKPAHLGL
jgi:pyruvate/2-oxoglutarate dehydrogenase complex dihydrolipoamide acyltransferase (E2) component